MLTKRRLLTMTDAPDVDALAAAPFSHAGVDYLVVSYSDDAPT